MLSFLIVSVMFLLAIWSMKRFGLKGISIAIGFIGSDTDSAGILYWIASYVTMYKFPVRFLVIIGSLLAAYRIMRRVAWKGLDRAFFMYQFLPLLLVSAAVVGISIFRGQGLVLGFSELIWLGTPFFFLWLAGSRRRRPADPFGFFVLVQGLLALVVIQGGATLGDLNGVSYASRIGGEGWLIDPNDIINASIALFDFKKHDLSVMKFGHFHNPNSLGVYSAMLLVVSVYKIFMNRKKNPENMVWILWLIPLVASIVLWMNSLTRGPVLFLLMWVIVMQFIQIRHKRIRILGFFAILTIMVVVVSNIKIIGFFKYLFVQDDSVSFVSRQSGYQFALQAMMIHPWLGAPASPSDPVPHILSLKIASYYGTPVAILLTIPFVHLVAFLWENYSDLVTRLGRMETNYMIAILCVLLGAMLTNGVVVYVLFWIAYAEILVKLDMINPMECPGIEEKR